MARLGLVWFGAVGVAWREVACGALLWAFGVGALRVEGLGALGVVACVAAWGCGRAGWGCLWRLVRLG
jgi:hypothetical protein